MGQIYLSHSHPIAIHACPIPWDVSHGQGRSQTFSFGGATGGASFATRGAVNGLCRTFRKRPTERYLILMGLLRGPGKILGGQCPPPAPLAPPLPMGFPWTSLVKHFVNVHLHCIVSNLKRISRISMLPSLEKFLRTPMHKVILLTNA